MVSTPDFIVIARALQRVKPKEGVESCEQWRCDVESIAVALSGMNPRFQQEKFLQECGVDQE